MKYNYLFLLFSVTLLLSTLEVSAQLNSEHAVGGRFGSAQGITYRYTLQQDRAVEGILSIQSNSKSRRFRLVGLYQYHRPLSGDFTWFYGYGASIGSYKQKSFTTVVTHEDGTTSSNRVDPDSELALSIEGIVGIQYQIPEAPLSVSLDLKPYFDFLQESSIRLIDPFGFSIRYHF